jgi:TolB-like protein
MLVIGITLSWNFEAKSEAKPSLAILPFFVERIENPARGIVLCPLCESIYQYGEVVPGSPYSLTQLLYAKIEALEKFGILPLEKVEEVLTPSAKKQFEEKPIPSSIQIGKELNVNFILVGYLFRFEERIGSRIGAEKPASVGFDVHLLRVRDGKRVWDGKFDETQQALSENLLKIGSFVRRKASWLTAEELSSVGMDEMLKRLPGPQELEEKP